jgi:hypothetical protein
LKPCDAAARHTSERVVIPSGGSFICWLPGVGESFRSTPSQNSLHSFKISPIWERPRSIFFNSS